MLDLIEKYQLSSDRYPQVEEQQGEVWKFSFILERKKNGDFHKRLRDKIESGGTSTLREKARHTGIEESTNCYLMLLDGVV